VTEPVTDFAHGPYKSALKAGEAAYMLVDPPITQWSVIELFGEGYDRPVGGGEIHGELWVVPTDRADEFAETKDAESFGYVDTYGYESESND
jgi:hypothetical protein